MKTRLIFKIEIDVEHEYDGELRLAKIDLMEELSDCLTDVAADAHRGDFDWKLGEMLIDLDGEKRTVL